MYGGIDISYLVCYNATAQSDKLVVSNKKTKGDTDQNDRCRKRMLRVKVKGDMVGFGYDGGEVIVPLKKVRVYYQRALPFWCDAFVLVTLPRCAKREKLKKIIGAAVLLGLLPTDTAWWRGTYIVTGVTGQNGQMAVKHMDE